MLYQVLKYHEKELNDDQCVELINLKRKLALKKGDDQLRVIPQIQNDNQNDYRAASARIRADGRKRTPLPSARGYPRIAASPSFRRFGLTHPVQQALIGQPVPVVSSPRNTAGDCRTSSNYRDMAYRQPSRETWHCDEDPVPSGNDVPPSGVRCDAGAGRASCSSSVFSWLRPAPGVGPAEHRKKPVKR